MKEEEIERRKTKTKMKEEEIERRKVLWVRRRENLEGKSRMPALSFCIFQIAKIRKI